MMRELDQVKRQLAKGNVTPPVVSDLVAALETHLYELAQLTPGGSEFHRNPSMCLDFYKHRIASADRIRRSLVEKLNECRNERPG